MTNVEASGDQVQQDADEPRQDVVQPPREDEDAVLAHTDAGPARASGRGRMVLAVAVVAVLAVGGGVTAVALATHSGATPGGGPSIAPVVDLSGVQSFPEKRNHVTGRVAYPQTPPAGGSHAPIWLNCGIYTSPVPNENAVHSLEHGVVWITYRPGLPAGDVARLAALVRAQDHLDLDPHLLLSPYPGLPAPVVVSAWGKQLRLTGASDPRLAAFVRKYERGPQNPEPGARCTGGVGTPAGARPAQSEPTIVTA